MALTALLQRVGAITPDDVAKVVAMLCSPDAEMIRGQVIVVDGGEMLRAPLRFGAVSRRWSGRRGSNPRPPAPKAGALPLRHSP